MRRQQQPLGGETALDARGAAGAASVGRGPCWKRTVVCRRHDPQTSAVWDSGGAVVVLGGGYAGRRRHAAKTASPAAVVMVGRPQNVRDDHARDEGIGKDRAVHRRPEEASVSAEPSIASRAWWERPAVAGAVQSREGVAWRRSVRRRGGGPSVRRSKGAGAAGEWPRPEHPSHDTPAQPSAVGGEKRRRLGGVDDIGGGGGGGGSGDGVGLAEPAAVGGGQHHRGQ